ncbi:hypothetical protein SDRG_17306 [Saprolegnia diclina VS20]|uniref:glucan 1,3-beta-glucosidase n=1 Tax=Saprolegnia diclina (strain VS20) TaxID=1156394 RepID=T0PHF9_SAPDV|nr:hypothetical protein SDRG_17306 [Saprolegnia diclina VS20]EQC24799.1 hypothetical protein SDRG_17306 [Saprolegnia diclina VS20]|eukprot:XP_008621769.1 hypothetical protein SDRG_17306 [Saprolegnia diclina VS20]
MERLITEGPRWIANDMTQWKAHRGMRVFVGEWSLAHGDLVRNDLRNPNNMRRYSTNALKALHEANAGWTYWSWKTHATDWRGDGWSLQNLLRAGVMDLKALHAPQTVFGNATNATATIIF